jgi:hypothetical protein
MLSTLRDNSFAEPEDSDYFHVQSSELYKEFQAQKEERIRHKWIESEKAGYDIGFERALTDWRIKYRTKWLEARMKKRLQSQAPMKESLPQSFPQ